MLVPKPDPPVISLNSFPPSRPSRHTDLPAGQASFCLRALVPCFTSAWNALLQVSERLTSFTSPSLLRCHLSHVTFPDHSVDNYSRLHPHSISPHSIYCCPIRCVHSVHLPCRAQAPQGQASPVCFACSFEPRTCACPATICCRSVLPLYL